ncbi:MAG: hypothetical protein Q7U20_09175 [Caulobacter sp.]|nr:hypothetical protein [Caulobacter sp.]
MSKSIEKTRDRLALRASTAFFLRSVDILARAVGDGDILRGVIFLAVVDSNTRHLKPSDSLAQAYSESGDTVPDALRRPVSVHALALELALPYETTRRHVNGLMAAGLCVRRETGVLVPAAVLAREPIVTAVRKNFDHLKLLFSDLRDGGVDLAS